MLEDQIEVMARNNEHQAKIPKNQAQIDELDSLQNQINLEKEKFRKFSAVKKQTDKKFEAIFKYLNELNSENRSLTIE